MTPETSHPIPFIPEGAELTPDVLEEQERRLSQILDELVAKADEHGATIRVLGALAFRIKCPDYKWMEYENERVLTDIDFMAYMKEIDRVQDTFFDLGWEENQNVLRLFGDKRRIFYHPTEPVHTDIFIDKLRFCHEIDFRGRLELDSPTITLADLLLEKLQIVEINRKDLIDVMMLLRQHAVSETEGDNAAVDGAYIARLMGGDWGFWRTATMNIEKVERFADEYLGIDEAAPVKKRLAVLSRLIDDQPKSMAWKLRSKIGDRVTWYREVEEVERD
ncbi:MAG: hypothetical protein GF405_04025 [Candidatus Eisenbacteria bacterium]|nr:hypothetical protein [Candidatus Eisenbacteria bacterium]